MLAQMMLNQYVQADRERQERISRAWDYYHGRHTPTLKATKGDPRAEDNITINLARLVVNKGVSFLFGFDLDFEVDPETGKRRAKKSPQEEWLAQAWDANKRMTLLHKLGTNGGACGDAFVRMLAPDPARNGHPYPRLVLWNPADVDVRWDPFDIEQVISYTRRWHGVDPVTVQPVAYRQVVERDGAVWLISTQVSKGGSTTWDDVEAPVVWPYPWSPVFHCQNLPCPQDYWGFADLEPDVLALNDRINFAASNTNRIYRNHGHPMTVIKGMQSNQIDVSIESVIVLPNHLAGVEKLEVEGDHLASGLELLKRLSEAFHEVARIPEVASGKVENIGQLSGLALQILYGPLVELTETKRLTYGEMITDIGRRMLEVGGLKAEVVKAQWPAVLPGDKKGEAETAEVLERVGVSKDTLLSEMGYDPDAEKQKKAEEAEADRVLGQSLLEQMGRGQNGLPAGGDGETETGDG